MRFFFIFLLIPFVSKAQPNCNGVKHGTFQITNELGKFIIERSGNFQLEKSINYGIICLYSVDEINDCQYVLKIKKILKKGMLPDPDNNESFNNEIYKVEGNTFFYRSTQVGSNLTIEGKLEKISDTVSEEFIKMLSEK